MLSFSFFPALFCKSVGVPSSSSVVKSSFPFHLAFFFVMFLFLLRLPVLVYSAFYIYFARCPSCYSGNIGKKFPEISRHIPEGFRTRIRSFDLIHFTFGGRRVRRNCQRWGCLGRETGAQTPRQLCRRGSCFLYRLTLPLRCGSWICARSGYYPALLGSSSWASTFVSWIDLGCNTGFDRAVCPWPGRSSV